MAARKGKPDAAAPGEAAVPEGLEGSEASQEAAEGSSSPEGEGSSTPAPSASSELESEPQAQPEQGARGGRWLALQPFTAAHPETGFRIRVRAGQEMPPGPEELMRKYEARGWVRFALD